MTATCTDLLTQFNVIDRDQSKGLIVQLTRFNHSLVNVGRDFARGKEGSGVISHDLRMFLIFHHRQSYSLNYATLVDPVRGHR